MVWLKEPVESWMNYTSYNRMRLFFTKLEVVNDGAERTIRLIQDFVNSVQDEEVRQDLMIAVEENRKEIPVAATKKDLTNISFN